MAARIVWTSVKQSAQICSKTRSPRLFSTTCTCLVRRVQRGAQQYDPEDSREYGEESDFLGITSEEGVVTVKNVLTDKRRRYEKFSRLTRSRDTKVSDERVVDAVFGTIRYDSENAPKYHGQYEDDTFLDETEGQSIASSPKLTIPLAQDHREATRENPVERSEDFESEDVASPRRSKVAKSEKSRTVTENSHEGWTEQLDRSDSLSEQPITENMGVAASLGSLKQVATTTTVNFESFETQVPRETVQWDGKPPLEVRTTDTSSRKNLVQDHARETLKVPQLRQHSAESAPEELPPKTERLRTKVKQKPQQQHTTSTEKESVVVSGTADNSSEDDFDTTATIRSLKDRENENEPNPLSRLSSEDRAPETAYQFVHRQSVAKESNDVKLDSKGFHILKSEIRPQIHNLLKSEMVELLRRRVLFDDHDIVVLDKPYGLVCHGPARSVPESCILTSLLPDLARALAPRGVKEPKLYTVHRLDRDVTGAMLLAKTQKMADILETLLKQRHITKTYWAITCKVPDHDEGIIDIPIAEGKVGSAERMVLCPRLEPKYEHLVPKFRKVYEAVTRYQVLSSNGHAAYLELAPTTGFRHQLRVHLGFGLRCPILGDHKYSHLRRLAPQKLPGDMLDRLGVRQSKVRDVPLHLHARSLVVPEVLDGRNLIVTAHPPYHFRKNLKRLKLSKK